MRKEVRKSLMETDSSKDVKTANPGRKPYTDVQSAARFPVKLPIALKSEGRSRDEAVKRLCAMARKRLAAGEWQQISLPGPPQTNPWIAYAGIWEDHPDFDDFLQNIEEHRRKTNGLDAAS